ncbi:uncharacterized protein LOC116255303 isoform X2 [Nymphaea colorata]|uniref:uncharacterized protein LOC116255303 isoform X2 n=1 Tax=Nymphaea colorata TaxID=210225 RepID=UPI00129D86FC|nr:uncharacterized protein LOC116255303 isoform X2 [Nymphaea colorata]
MIKNSKGVLTIAERCKNILAANYQCVLNTVTADTKGSKEDIHSSRVKYMFRKGRPYIWIPEDDLHNVRPSRIALTGDIVSIGDDKVQLARDSLQEAIRLEQKVLNQCSYAVSGIFSSSSIKCKTRSSNLQEILDGSDNYTICRFNLRSCTLIDNHGSTHEVDMEEFESSKADPLSPFSETLIDGINQSQARRRALMLFCFVYLNTIARDALMLSADRSGFDVLGKVPCSITKDGFGQYQWKEFRFPLKEEADNIEAFCHSLVEMEDEVLQTVSSYSGLG